MPPESGWQLGMELEGQCGFRQTIDEQWARKRIKSGGEYQKEDHASLKGDV